MGTKRAAICLALGIILVQGWRSGEAAAGDAEAARDAFVRRYVEAVNAGDVAALKRLVHPGSLACMTPETAEFFEDTFRRRLRHTIPANIRVRLEPIGEAETLLFDGAVTYPVRPTHFLQIDFPAGERRHVTLVIQVAIEGSKWLEVVPCPTAETMERARQAKVEGERLRQHARTLAAEMKSPLREELRTLLAGDRRLDAVRRYSAQTGADLTLSHAVIKELMQSEGR